MNSRKIDVCARTHSYTPNQPDRIKNRISTVSNLLLDLNARRGFSVCVCVCVCRTKGPENKRQQADYKWFVLHFFRSVDVLKFRTDAE